MVDRLLTVGLLTGGGDCPGLNAVIRAATRRLLTEGHAVRGILRGWRGLIDGQHVALGIDDISGILPRGGTILRTSRTNPFREAADLEAVLRNLAELDCLIAIGGEDTLGVAHRLHAEHGAPVIGVPKTIDNDLGATDLTFGFDTAVEIATEAIDRLHTTAESHDRVMVVEVMGRHAGWLAVQSGLAGGADVILIPEFPLTVERCAELIRARHARGRDYSIVVVSEGWPLTHEAGSQGLATQTADLDAFGHVRLGGVGERLGASLQELTGFDTRVTVLGHLQRGGTPTAFDRVLATRFGLLAASLAMEGRHGTMTALRGTDIVAVPLADAVRELRTVPRSYYEMAEVFFG
jgi:ATP-dependent phosphofructokinase / diphosphate-dependent phosphofructokinase